MESQLYREMYNIEESHWWFEGRREILFDVLKRTVGKTEKILDIGCGTGLNSSFLIDLGSEIHGLEMSDDAIEFSKKRAPHLKIIKGEFPNVEIGERFNLITLFDVLEHFEDDAAALKKIHSLLDKNGYMALSVPAFSFLWSEHDELAHHKRRYSKSLLKERFRKAGFVPVKITYFNAFLFPPIFIFRLLRKFFGFRGGKSDFFMAPRPFNSLLAKFFGAERFLLRFMDFPFGVSILAVAKKI